MSDIHDRISKMDMNDLYYSAKQEATILAKEAGECSVAYVDGQPIKYTEMVRTGEKPMSEWNDLELVATIDVNETKIDPKAVFKDYETYQQILGR